MSSTRTLLLRSTKHTIHTRIIKSVQIHKMQSCNGNIHNYRLLSTNIDISFKHSIGIGVPHPIVSILEGCKSLKDCYIKIRNEHEYISLLSNNNSTYSYDNHKYFILKLTEKASQDKYLTWQMIFNIIEFYSNQNEIFHLPIESIYNFLSILCKRGDFNAVSSMIEQLITQSNDRLPILQINNQLFIMLIHSLRISKQYEKGHELFQQAINEFNIEPTIPLLLQGYMCNPSKWKYNFMTLLNEYNLQCNQYTYNKVIQFHLQCIINIINDINEYIEFEMLKLHTQQILFYLNHSKSLNCFLNVDIFDRIISVSFDYMLHSKISDNNFIEWIDKYIKHIIIKQLNNQIIDINQYQMK
eukprot:74324_1